MRYVAFFLIVLASFYLFFLKPFLVSRGIDYGWKEVKLDTQKKTLSVGEVFLYIPLDGGKVFLNLEKLRVSFDSVPRIDLRKGSLNLHLEVSGDKKSQPAKHGGSPPPLIIPPQIRYISVYVDEFLFNLSGVTDLSVHVRGFNLNEGKLNLSSRIYLPNREIDLFVENVVFGEESVSVGLVSARSDLFDLRVSGDVKGENPVAEFKVSGEIKRIEAGEVVIDPIRISGSGRASYEGVFLDLEGFTKTLRLKGRKDFKDITLTADLIYSPQGKSEVKGEINNEYVSLNYTYSINSNGLSLRVDKLPVDSQLLGVEAFVFAWAKGDLAVDINTGDVVLLADLEGLMVEDFVFQSANLSVDYNYVTKKGEVNAFLQKFGTLTLHGKIDGSEFRGLINGNDVLVATAGLFLYGSFSGFVEYAGALRTSVEGVLKEIQFRDIQIGDVPFSAQVEGKVLNVSYRGSGFQGRVSGHLGEDVILRHEFHNFRRPLKGVNLRIGEGVLEAVVGKGKTNVAFGFKGAEVKGSGFSSSLSGEGWLDVGGEVNGNIHLRLDKLIVKEEDLGKGRADLEVVGGKLKGKYSFDGILSLNGNIGGGLRPLYFETFGDLSGEKFKTSYRFVGTPMAGSFYTRSFLYLADQDHDSITLEVEGNYNGSNLDVRIKPTEFQVHALGGKLEGARLIGRLDDLTLDLKPVHLFLLNQEVFETLPAKGTYKDGTFNMTLKSGGALIGDTRIGIGEDLEVTSEGYIDLNRLSFFIATPLNGRAEGKVRYKIYMKGEDLVLELITEDNAVAYSRYISVPMNLWLEGRLVKDTLSAFFFLEKESKGVSLNIGSSKFKDTYVYILAKEFPFFYRSGGITLDLKISSEGWVNLKDGKDLSIRVNSIFSGDVVVSKLGGGEGGTKGGGDGNDPQESSMKVDLDVGFETERPLRVSLPEGYVYVNVKGWVGGSAQDPDYSVVVEFLSGELTYFSRRFFVKGGRVVVMKEEGVEDRLIDLSLVNPSPDLSIYIDLRGELENPDLIVWSEPPRSSQELLTKLIIGSSAEGILPVAQTLFKRFGYVGDIKSGISSLLGVDISLSTETGSQGDIGFNVNIRKKIARVLAVEYQQSTLRNPRATYYGGSIFLGSGASFYGRVFSDNTSEVKIRFMRKFDF